MHAKLSDAFLRNLPAAIKKIVADKGGVEVIDTMTGRGFGVRVGKYEKSFFLKRRGPDGKQIRLSLGKYGAVTLEEARAGAAQAVTEIKKGIDPRAELHHRKNKSKADSALIFSHLATRFLEEYCTRAKLRPKTIEGYVWALQGPPSKAWADRPIGEIKDLDLIRVVDQYEKDGKLVSARNFIAYAGKFFSWCRSKRLIAVSPVQDIDLLFKPKDFKRARVLSMQELSIVLAAADCMGHPAGTLIKILALLGQRRGETSLMKWSDLHFDGTEPRWIIPNEDTNTLGVHSAPHDVPLPPEVVAMLKALSDNGEFIFSGTGKASVSDFPKIKKDLDDLVAKVEVERGVNKAMAPFRLHDLRRTFATQLPNELGVHPHVVEAIQNHKSGYRGGISGTYNWSTYKTERRIALNKWAAKLSGLGHLEKKI